MWKVQTTTTSTKYTFQDNASLLFSGSSSGGEILNIMNKTNASNLHLNDYSCLALLHFDFLIFVPHAIFSLSFFLLDKRKRSALFLQSATKTSTKNECFYNCTWLHQYLNSSLSFKLSHYPFLSVTINILYYLDYPNFYLF